MIEFSVSVEIDRSVNEVFAYVTDPAKLPRWQTNTISVTQETDGPLGVGTRLREVHRAPRGRDLVSLVEVSEFEPGRCFALRILEGPLPIDGRFTFAPTELATRVELLGKGQLTGVLRLGEPVVNRVLRRQFARDLTRLKRALEESSASARGRETAPALNHDRE
jgi:uncharacterized protein YndB with AHSA1/START domain